MNSSPNNTNRLEIIEVTGGTTVGWVIEDETLFVVAFSTRPPHRWKHVTMDDYINGGEKDGSGHNRVIGELLTHTLSSCSIEAAEMSGAAGPSLEEIQMQQQQVRRTGL